MGGVQVEGRGLEDLRDEYSVNEEGRERLPRSILEKFHRTSCNDGSQELIAMFHSPHRKGRASLTVVAHTLDQLV